MLEEVLANVDVTAETPGTVPKDLAAMPATGSPTSNVKLANPPSNPRRSLFFIMPAARSEPSI